MENTSPYRFLHLLNVPEAIQAPVRGVAARAFVTAHVTPIRGACSLYTRNVVPIADVDGARQDAWAAGAPFADGKSVEIGRLDKPEAIHRLPPSGGGGRGPMGRKKAIDGGERGLPNNPAAKRLNNYTPALKRLDITIDRALRRAANQNNLRGHSLYNSYPLHHYPKNWQIIRSMEENYEEQSKVIHVDSAGADYHRPGRIRFECGSQTPSS